MVSMLDTRRCASEEIERRRGVETKRRASKDVGPQRGGELGVPRRLEKGMSAKEDARFKGGWIVRSHIGWGREQNILHKGVETST